MRIISATLLLLTACPLAPDHLPADDAGAEIADGGEQNPDGGHTADAGQIADAGQPHDTGTRPDAGTPLGCRRILPDRHRFICEAQD